MTSVFISSTGKDLAEYREAAIEICNRLGLTPIAMEFFEAMGAGATEGSKRKLEKADVYVGIFAHRYGYIEWGHSKSVTEIEFDYAGELALDQLCFLVERGYPWPPDLIDYENIEKLKAFRKKINAALIRSEFTTVDDFRAKLMQSLVEWLGERRVEPHSSAVLQIPLSVAPPRPALIIGRNEEIDDLKSRLGVGPGGGKRELTIVRGWPGVGKTTIVNTLAYDPEMNAAYSDGVLWATLGEKPSVFSELASWARHFGLADVAQTGSLKQVINRLRADLQSKKKLLIVDDVWRTDDAAPFKQLVGPSCALLITTRFRDVAREIATEPEDVFVLNVLKEVEAVELLTRVAPDVVQRYSEGSAGLVRDLEGLPLAIRVAGRLLHAEAQLDGRVLELMEELRESRRLLDEVAPDDRFDPETGTTPTINLLLKRSTDRLGRETRERFAMLGVFAPKPATFDQAAMGSMWEVGDPLPTIRKLVDRGLLEPIPTAGRYQLHALLVMHARSLLEVE